MKIISSAMAAHLKQDVTTLTTCWKITRTDGKVFGFTEHDSDITYLDVPYKSNGGFNKSALKNSATMSVDNLEVNGFLTDDTIEDTELRNGAFDYALVEIFILNYMDYSMGTIKLRYGYFGEVKTAPSGAFLVELRGLIQLLSQKIGEVYTPECRADLGDSRCKVMTVTPERQSNKKYYSGQRVLADTVGNQTKPPIAVPFKNMSFDVNTGAERGWSMDYYVRYTASTLFVQPHSPPYFARFMDVNNLGRMTQTSTLLTGPIDIATIQKGDLKLRFGGYFNSLADGQEPRVTMFFYSRENATQLITTIEKNFPAVAPPRSWKYLEFEETIPVNARSVRINIEVIGFPDYGKPDMGVDSVELEIIRPTTLPDFSTYGGVEWTCITEGVTAVYPPIFPAVLGTIVDDGTAQWMAISPEHTFLDTIAVDAVDSSTLKLSTLDKPDGWFDWGVLKILTGPNAGIAIEPMSWKQSTKTLKLAMPLPHETTAGTKIQISTGCDKRRSTCLAKFNNLNNFRGEPDIPGINQYFKVAGIE